MVISYNETNNIVRIVNGISNDYDGLINKTTITDYCLNKKNKFTKYDMDCLKLVHNHYGGQITDGLNKINKVKYQSSLISPNSKSQLNSLNSMAKMLRNNICWSDLRSLAIDNEEIKKELNKIISSDSHKNISDVFKDLTDIKIDKIIMDEIQITSFQNKIKYLEKVINMNKKNQNNLVYSKYNYSDLKLMTDETKNLEKVNNELKLVIQNRELNKYFKTNEDVNKVIPKHLILALYLKKYDENGAVINSMINLRNEKEYDKTYGEIIENIVSVKYDYDDSFKDMKIQDRKKNGNNLEMIFKLLEKKYQQYTNLIKCIETYNDNYKKYENEIKQIQDEYKKLKKKLNDDVYYLLDVRKKYYHLLESIRKKMNEYMNMSQGLNLNNPTSILELNSLSNLPNSLPATPTDSPTY